MAVRWRTVVVGAVLMVQVGVPAVALTQGRNERFGWQMFAASKAGLWVEVTMADGSQEVVDSVLMAGNYRPEVDWEDHLPSFVCDRYPDAMSVRLFRDEPRFNETTPCE